MIQLGLSLMAKVPPETMVELQKLLTAFEARTKIHVNVTVFPWSTAWSAISRYAAYGGGPDVSEIGTTWMGDLVEKRVLASLSKSDIARLGGEMNYYPQLWQTCSIMGSPEVWAVPWLTETRVIFFRRDWFEKNDLKPETAFLNALSLDQSLEKLQSSGISQPWSVTSRRSMNTVHFVSSWIWGMGGDFISADGKNLTLTSKESLDGLVAYFALKKYMGPFASRMSDLLANTSFWGGQAAVTIDGHFTYAVQRRTGNATVFNNVNISPVPGVPFVGGSNLVVWKNCKEPEAAMELINFLNSPEVVLTYQKIAGHLPARRDIFHSFIAQQNDPIYSVLDQMLHSGRSFPVVPRWGRIEHKMVEAFGLIWEDWLTQPEADLRTLISNRLRVIEDAVEEGLY